MKKHHGGEKLGKNRRDDRIVTPNELDLTLWVPNHGAKFHQNQVRTATVGEVTDRQTDRQTDRHTNASDLIICPKSQQAGSNKVL